MTHCPLDACPKGEMTRPEEYILSISHLHPGLAHAGEEILRNPPKGEFWLSSAE